MLNGLAGVFYVTTVFVLFYKIPDLCDTGFCFLFSILKIVLLIFYETYWELKKSAAFCC